MINTYYVNFVCFRSILYRRKYLSNDRFDNFYITYRVRQIDEKRTKLGKEPILPLNSRESRKYIKTSKCLRLKVSGANKVYTHKIEQGTTSSNMSSTVNGKMVSGNTNIYSYKYGHSV